MHRHAGIGAQTNACFLQELHAACWQIPALASATNKVCVSCQVKAFVQNKGCSLGLAELLQCGMCFLSGRILNLHKKIFPPGGQCLVEFRHFMCTAFALGVHVSKRVIHTGCESLKRCKPMKKMSKLWCPIEPFPPF